MKRISCEDFNLELFNDGCFSEIHSEMFHSGSFSSEKILKLFKAEAEKRNIELTDLEEFDYDKEFYENYKADQDKGLS